MNVVKCPYCEKELHYIAERHTISTYISTLDGNTIEKIDDGLDAYVCPHCNSFYFDDSGIYDIPSDLIQKLHEGRLTQEEFNKYV